MQKHKPNQNVDSYINLSSKQKAILKTFKLSASSSNLYIQSFIHTSYLNEHPTEIIESNERLEFFGDSILAFIVAEYLYINFEDFTEGTLTSWRSQLINGQTLARIAKDIGLGDCLLLGKGEENNGGRNNVSILEGAFEAFIAAIYLDAGIEVTKKIILSLLKDDLNNLIADSIIIDSKGELQKLFQTKNLMPKYNLISTHGPEHSPIYNIELLLPNGQIIKSQAGNIQAAEKDAALRALRLLERGD
ncbi:MAG: ribonuclease III [Dehalococcoidia bacterium]|nr:ribonuclease III [Dehalococcoidia bacterium]